MGYLNITKRCNLSCDFCLIGSEINNKDWRSRESNVDQVKEIIDHHLFKDILYIVLFGGEPTMNADLAQIVGMLKKRRHLVSMISNGYKLAEKAAELARVGLDAVTVSLYDENEDLLYRDLPLVTPHLPTKICKMLDASIFDDPSPAERACDLATKTGCVGVFFQNTLFTLTSTSDLSGAIMYDDQVEQYEVLKSSIESRFPKLPIYWPSLAPRSFPAKRICRMPWSTIFFDHLGSIGYCCKSNTSDHNNIFHTPEENIVNGEFWSDVRSGLLNNKSELSEMCRNCFIANDIYGATV